MITFIARLKVRPENGPAFETLMMHVRDLTKANEPDVVHYEWSKGVDEPDTYLVVEVYRDAEVQAAHMATPWVTESLPVSRQLVETFDIKQYVTPGTTPATRRIKEK